MQEFSRILEQATAGIQAEYFQLPIDGREDPIYRERVYCYELYHQLRVIWPPQSRFTLSGEVDKSGHPLIRGNGLDRSKPDFLVHTPGDMAGNYAVIEVKPICVSASKVLEDIETLSNYVTYAQYSRALFLVYGREVDGPALRAAIDSLQAHERPEIEVWYHAAPYEAARRQHLSNRLAIY